MRARLVRLEQRLHPRLILRDLLACLALRNRHQDLAAKPVTLEVDRDGEPGTRPAVQGLDRDGSNRTHGPVQNTERGLSRRVVLSDLIGHRAVAARHPPGLPNALADSHRLVAFRLHVDDLFLPLAVALDVVEIREHLVGPSVDLDALGNGSHWRLLVRMTRPDPPACGLAGQFRALIDDSSTGLSLTGV